MLAMFFVLGACSPGIFALGWIIGRDWDAIGWRSTSKLPTAKALKRNRYWLPGEWR